MRNANRAGDFRTGDRILPVKNLYLRAHEELLTQRAKKRPGIILSAEVDVFSRDRALIKTEGERRIASKILYLLSRLIASNQKQSLSGFPSEMVARIRCLIYRQFFYFPACSSFKEGIARFDRIQVVSGRNPAAIEPLGIALSQEVFALFLAMFVYCATGIEDNDLTDIRAMVRDALPV